MVVWSILLTSRQFSAEGNRWSTTRSGQSASGVAEVQALLDDHVAGGEHAAADVVAKAQAVLSESGLLQAMFDVGYFPPNTPTLFVHFGLLRRARVASPATRRDWHWS